MSFRNTAIIKDIYSFLSGAVFCKPVKEKSIDKSRFMLMIGLTGGSVLIIFFMKS